MHWHLWTPMASRWMAARPTNCTCRPISRPKISGQNRQSTTARRLPNSRPISSSQPSAARSRASSSIPTLRSTSISAPPAPGRTQEANWVPEPFPGKAGPVTILRLYGPLQPWPRQDLEAGRNPRLVKLIKPINEKRHLNMKTKTHPYGFVRRIPHRLHKAWVQQTPPEDEDDHRHSPRNSPHPTPFEDEHQHAKIFRRRLPG